MQSSRRTNLVSKVRLVVEVGEGFTIPANEEWLARGIKVGATVVLGDVEDLGQVVGKVLRTWDVGEGQELALLESGEGIEPNVGAEAWLLGGGFPTRALRVGNSEDGVVLGLESLVLGSLYNLEL